MTSSLDTDIKVGDLVRCIEPVSEVDSMFDLSPDKIYEVTYRDNFGNIHLLGQHCGYAAKRFERVEDIDMESTEGVDFF